jgi:pyruvate dehydrogenase (quinone)
MANALPQAIGAHETFPDRQEICLSGDGGFTMLMGDFLSLKQLKLPIKVIIFNNSSLSFVELEMKAAGFLIHVPDLIETDFLKLAEAVEILGLRAERPEQVKTMLSQALEHEGPALVNVAVNRQELLVPPSINLAQIKGFTLYMIKAVLNCKGDEVVDLARTNLFM